MEDIFIVRVEGLVVVEIGATEILALSLGAWYFSFRSLRGWFVASRDG